MPRLSRSPVLFAGFLGLASLSSLACANGSARGEDPDSGADSRDQDAGEVTEPATSLGRLDAALAEHWRSAGVEPAALASDSEYLRRLSLDLIGRVPTRAEVEAFTASDDPQKRAAKVDELLASPAFAAHWADHWARLLLPGDNKGKRIGAPLETYLGEVLEANRPWDEVVDELLGSNGALEDTPALGYVGAQLARNGDREAALAQLSATTARVFLGARIECAQCHDHPYVDFSRDDFWAMTAYFGRTGADIERKARPPEVEIYERGAGQLRVALGGDDEPRKALVAPRFMGSDTVDADAKQKGGKKKTAENKGAEKKGDDSAMGGDSMDGPKAKKDQRGGRHDSAVGPTRRERLAAAIIADPRFAEATVGLVWSQLFGRGIVEPWDDLLSDGELPPLLVGLAEDFRAHGHDLHQLVRTVVLSQAYQRSSASALEPKASAARERAFAQAAVRPLPAEPLFASVITATGLEQVGGKGFKKAVRQRKDKALREFEFVFGDDEMASADAFTGSVPQALLLLNGSLTNEGVVARKGGALASILAESSDRDARLRALWLTVYGRTPTDAELDIGREAVSDGANPKAYEDLMFAMLYSSEFSSNH